MTQRKEENNNVKFALSVINKKINPPVLLSLNFHWFLITLIHPTVNHLLFKVAKCAVIKFWWIFFIWYNKSRRLYLLVSSILYGFNLLRAFPKLLKYWTIKYFSTTDNKNFFFIFLEALVFWDRGKKKSIPQLRLTVRCCHIVIEVHKKIFDWIKRCKI